jgi:8-oxo-dGTP pyrophosphatase MutT (NUDIX family)
MTMADTRKSPDKGLHKDAVQYAALPWRRTADGEVCVLLITSRETRRWVIPKGWPMKGRTPAEAAAQEAFEEAGVTGRTDAQPLGAYDYGKRLRQGLVQDVRVLVFALEVTAEQPAWPEQAQREKLWTSPAEAALLVEEPDLQALLRGFAAPPATGATKG